MSEHSTYVPGSSLEKWFDDRLPILRFSKEHLMDFPTPRNLNYWWTFGAILAIMLVVQIVTGIILAMHYVPSTALAFDSVEKLMRDVNYGWLLRYAHMNGASMFFAIVYIHLFRGLYYGSYKAPRELLWILGVIILLLLIATAFMGGRSASDTAAHVTVQQPEPDERCYVCGSPTHGTRARGDLRELPTRI